MENNVDKKINIAIAMIDRDNGTVIGFAEFTSEERLTKVMAECKKKGVRVMTMNKEKILKLMKTGASVDSP